MIDFDKLLPEKKEYTEDPGKCISDLCEHNRKKGWNDFRSVARALLERRLKVVGWGVFDPHGSIITAVFSDNPRPQKAIREFIHHHLDDKIDVGDEWDCYYSEGYRCVPLLVIDGGDDE